jgi:hypothetical protein
VSAFEAIHQRIAAAGLGERCRVALRDYRDQDGDGTFDKIASIGMFEHVGLRNLPVYFATAFRLLRDRGLAVGLKGLVRRALAVRPFGRERLLAGRIDLSLHDLAAPRAPPRAA